MVIDIALDMDLNVNRGFWQKKKLASWQEEAAERKLIKQSIGVTLSLLGQ